MMSTAGGARILPNAAGSQAAGAAGLQSARPAAQPCTRRPGAAAVFRRYGLEVLRAYRAPGTPCSGQVAQLDGLGNGLLAIDGRQLAACIAQVEAGGVLADLDQPADLPGRLAQ